jgi:hypothetical protein
MTPRRRLATAALILQGETMSLLLIRIGLQLTSPVVPEVRAWIDLHPDAALASEVELPLERDGESVWSARLLAGTTGSGYFLYRIGLAAHPGATWSLTVHDGAGRNELLADSDVAPLTKCWLVGTCPFRSQPASPKNRVGAARRTVVPHEQSRSGQLVLLRGGHVADRGHTRSLPASQPVSD